MVQRDLQEIKDRVTGLVLKTDKALETAGEYLVREFMALPFSLKRHIEPLLQQIDVRYTMLTESLPPWNTPLVEQTRARVRERFPSLDSNEGLNYGPLYKLNY